MADGGRRDGAADEGRPYPPADADEDEDEDAGATEDEDDRDDGRFEVGASRFRIMARSSLAVGRRVPLSASYEPPPYALPLPPPAIDDADEDADEDADAPMPNEEGT